MCILGLILVILGLAFGIHWLFVLGVVVTVLGLVLMFASLGGHRVGGRTWY